MHSPFLCFGCRDLQSQALTTNTCCIYSAMARNQPPNTSERIRKIPINYAFGTRKKEASIFMRYMWPAVILVFRPREKKKRSVVPAETSHIFDSDGNAPLETDRSSDVWTACRSGRLVKKSFLSFLSCALILLAFTSLLIGIRYALLVFAPLLDWWSHLCLTGGRT